MSADAIYAEANAMWEPIKADIATFTRPAGLKLARHLWNKFGGRGLDYPYRSEHLNKGSRSWASSKSNCRSLSFGVRRCVHDISHAIHHARSNGFKASHCLPHAELERAMVRYVIEAGLYRAKPAKPKPTLAEKHQAELARLDAAEKRWTTKAKRAATALKKIRQRQRRLHALQDADDRAVVKRVNELVSAMHR